MVTGAGATLMTYTGDNRLCREKCETAALVRPALPFNQAGPACQRRARACGARRGARPMLLVEDFETRIVRIDRGNAARLFRHLGFLGTLFAVLLVSRYYRWR